ncbi:MAG: PEGA domain-containing protein [Epulopiscium sp.]|nr:PEGA domain-containing protein [Candidatus Epulonipiscium sp.]
MKENRNQPKKNKNSAQQQMDTIKKILWIGGAGLFVMIMMTLIVSYFVTKDKKQPSKLPKDPISNEETQDAGKTIKSLGVIWSIDDGERSIDLYDIEKEEKLILHIGRGVELKDQYGQAMTLSKLRTGDIVQLQYVQKDNKNQVESLRISAETWTHQNITQLQIDKEQKQIQVGSNRYHYNDALITRYKNQSFDLNQLDPVDQVTLTGYKNQVWLIVLEKSHGYVTVENYQQYEEGTLDIDTNISIPLKEANQIPVLEGLRKVVIQQKDKEPYITNIMVEAGKISTIKPGEVQAKTGAVELQVNVSDYDLYINGVHQMNAVQPLNLEYGEYEISIRKTDYADWSGTLSVHQPYTKVKVDLIQNAKFIHIQTNPSGAEIYIDDNFSGYTPVSIPIKLGEHRVLIRKEGYHPKEYTINIQTDTQDVHYTFPPLEPKEAEEPPAEDKIEETQEEEKEETR